VTLHFLKEIRMQNDQNRTSEVSPADVGRRRLVQAAGAAGALTVAGMPALSQAQSKEAMRIGLITVKTGPLASGGIDMERALVMYLKERNYTLAGRKIELIVADSGGVPATARTKTQELVEKNKVHMLIGPLAAFEALAIDDYIAQQKIPTLAVAAAEDMTQRKANPWFVRATSTSSQCAHPMADYCAKTLKWKRMVLIADDIAYGQDRAENVPAADRARLRHVPGSAQDQCRCGLFGLCRLQRIPLSASIQRVRLAWQGAGGRWHDRAGRIGVAQHG
jgi:ABC-type branched-subunit amino acid transport system substrate-binding protein